MHYAWTGMNDVTKTFLLVSSSVRSKQLLCFVRGHGQKSEQKHTTKNFVGFHNHSPLSTMSSRKASHEQLRSLLEDNKTINRNNTPNQKTVTADNKQKYYKLYTNGGCFISWTKSYPPLLKKRKQLASLEGDTQSTRNLESFICWHFLSFPPQKDLSL